MLKWYKNNEATYNIVCVTNLNEIMLHTIHAAASYGSSNSPGTSPPSQTRHTISQSMEDRLAAWTKKQVQRNESVNLMSTKGETSSHFGDSPWLIFSEFCAN